MLLPGLRELVDNPEPSAVATGGRLALAAVVAAARGGARPGRPCAPARPASWPRPIALVVVLVAVRPLLPAGTLVLRRGLPSVIALRGAIAATFFATEIYLPYLLQEHYGLSAWLSGAALTVGALGWSGASQVQASARCAARPPHRSEDRRRAAARVASRPSWSSTALQLSPWLIGAAWVLAGAGMGLMFPRISALVLAASTERDQGSNTAAMSISDAVGGRPRSRWPGWCSPPSAPAPTSRRSSAGAGADHGARGPSRVLVSRRTA